jgi:peptidyl-prolyl cis-trans isomerase D
LAGGATLEELASEQGLEYGTVEVTAEGTGEGIAAYQSFRAAALAATTEDFPEMKQLEDGGLYALQVTEIRAPALRPLADVHDLAVELWTKDETGKQLLAAAQAIADAPDFAAAAAEKGLTPQTVAPIRRDGFVEGLPAPAIAEVFKLPEGGATAAPGDGAAYALKLASVAVPGSGDAEADKIRASIAQQAQQGMAQDALALFTQAAVNASRISLNQTALNAVHAQMP